MRRLVISIWYENGESLLFRRLHFFRDQVQIVPEIQTQIDRVIRDRKTFQRNIKTATIERSRDREETISSMILDMNKNCVYYL